MSLGSSQEIKGSKIIQRCLSGHENMMSDFGIAETSALRYEATSVSSMPLKQLDMSSLSHADMADVLPAQLR